MQTRLNDRIHNFFERWFPEQRLFLRSDNDNTRFIRLRPGTIALALFGSTATIAWAIIASSILLMDMIGAGNVREQAGRDRALYEERLNSLSQSRESAEAEALTAHQRFNAALTQVSAMQSKLLESEARLRELETGIGVVQTTLRRTIHERDTAMAAKEQVTAQLEGRAVEDDDGASVAEVDATLAFLNEALERTAVERDDLAKEAELALEEAEAATFERDLILDRNDKIFTQLEEALTVSVEPLEKMFTKAGLPPEKLLNAVKKGYSGQGGPLTPISFSTKGSAPSADESRANLLLEGLDRMNLYRIAAERAPFGMPLKDSFRFTSPFGPRWGRMHNGTDFAAGNGTPIYATADGVVTTSGWHSGFGQMIKIRHDFGVETWYGHMSRLRVKEGQRVSKGQRIGDMGSTGRSTGTHLHYEVHVNGKPVNPMNFIKAAKDVF
ncbi:M23 family metallopeptidase [Tropicimonas isoalkanivorans]|uniref:Murein DD-endopeptidase MepM and murein hydrolase activator NlpD, contain LysM domain n=1 Tax=Tropicimonas isoalkanivorans TaxID=441112 RepID=A0A1I1E328_9RHOB|nr:M23 family metallopeptidase [Tropicimonas isoalkanivorans]SFB81484.1 Murein DD-endopeptidase MepM and murein hydrolase activator NlpD, contain LysM domain [Tropicimonas isoalkanivorans]